MLLVWFALLPVLTKLDLGPVYVCLSIIVMIFFNLGKRKAGEASAYSIFNNMQQLPGQLQLAAFFRRLYREE